MIHQEDGAFFSKFHQITKSSKIGEEDGSEIVEEDGSIEARLLVRLQDQIPAEMNTMLFDVLQSGRGRLRCHYVRDE
jgi:hypothetical protein